MVLTRKISFLTAGYIFLSAAAYLLLFNKNSWKDEFFLTGAFLFFVVLVLLVVDLEHIAGLDVRVDRRRSTWLCRNRRDPQPKEGRDQRSFCY